MPLPSGVQSEQILKAVKALLKHIEKQREKANDLIEEDELIFLQVSLKKTPQQTRKDKPLRIPVPHSLYDHDGAEICLIVKDKKGEGHKAAKERVKQEKLAKVAKVIGLSKLKSKFESHEAKRNLCAQYDLFLADDRVIPLLPKLIENGLKPSTLTLLVPLTGKKFFQKKKQPIPVDLTSKDWAGQVRKATEATYMYHTGGTSLSIRAARSSFTAEQCAENVAAVIEGSLQHIPRKWGNVQALFLRTAESAALPIYQELPEHSTRIMVGGNEQKEQNLDLVSSL